MYSNFLITQGPAWLNEGFAETERDKDKDRKGDSIEG